MTFRCANRGFERAVNDPGWGYLGRGTVMSNTQSSSFIRAATTTRCNGFTFPPGQLRRHDLGYFDGAIPHPVLLATRRASETRQVILYRFFHFQRRVRIEHGWFLTREDHREIARFVTGCTWKSGDVIAQCAAALCTPQPSGAQAA